MMLIVNYILLDEPISFEDADINAVTGLLKLYFRELKNPLMTFEYYDWFIDAASMYPFSLLSYVFFFIQSVVIH